MKQVPYEYTHGWSPYIRATKKGYEVYVLGMSEAKPGMRKGVLLFTTDLDEATAFADAERKKTEDRSKR